uniref:Uncharacterized protein n=1 Tax=Anguilla anguilla TaxID=7936 RepID=A0A0E9PFA3_ANGAN
MPVFQTVRLRSTELNLSPHVLLGLCSTAMHPFPTAVSNTLCICYIIFLCYISNTTAQVCVVLEQQ